MDTGAGKENALVELAGTIVKCACSLLTLDVSDAVGSLTDLLQKRVGSRLEQRRIERVFDECADVIAERLLRLVDHEFGYLAMRDKARMTPEKGADTRLKLAENERIAATLAVRDTLSRGELSLRTIINADLDARGVEHELAEHSRDVLRTAGLGEPGEQFYHRVLRESCAYLVEAVMTFPQFEKEALRQLLRRETYIIEDLKRILDQLPKQKDATELEVDYRRLVVNRYDRMELFGIANLAESNRRYPLSVAYVSLGALGWEGETDGDATGQRVEEALADTRRVLLVGDAGSGKSTLLRWLAVRAAGADFAAPLDRWNGCIPFLVPLRRYPEGDSFPSVRTLIPELFKSLGGDGSDRWTVLYDASRSRRGRSPEWSNPPRRSCATSSNAVACCANPRTAS